jgi:hypothetical protein
VLRIRYDKTKSEIGFVAFQDERFKVCRN